MIIKRIDSVGRIIIPMEIRNSLNWKSNDEIELISQKDGLFLKKHYSKEKACCMCGQQKDLFEISGEYICYNCIEKIKQFKSTK